MTDAVTEQAHAKLNLTLEVLGRRMDGYHDLASIMQTVELHDTVVASPADEVSVDCSDGSLTGPSNLAFVAATALQKAAGVRAGARIVITKRIPVAAGLGGGSADAAATLRALNRLWGTGLSQAHLAEVGAAVGSDVPFLVWEGTALVRGRGEAVQPLPDPAPGRFLLVCPRTRLESKTRQLFSMITPDMYTPGALSQKLAARIRIKGDVPAELMFNVFNAVAPAAFPGWRDCRDAVASLGAREVMLAGAGPSLFALVTRKELGTAWQLLLNGRGPWDVHLTEAWTPGRGGRR
jgi:4-diphosphocytidyl-2-C-methyl-D-erythritol kinase